ncbi:hypothetical protein WK59_28590 [Burkholderia ubonensis]|uniref:hypothetical protein n=1 Tax=Burkholderia ubonensis TaxID=101571 RepID=UPI00075C0D4D|nr:hypothetical protein [Burkholderia ubonensis]KVT95925.1 hypothetical protein WK59_28590 [Burkholderia ubonensis]KVU08812.1 hypothetical protein WK62_06860 [Burkholderia ubonensis]
MHLLKQHLALFDLQQPSRQGGVALEKLRQSARCAAAAALAPHVRVAHSPVLGDAHVANERAKAERPSVRVRRLGTFKPAVQLSAIDACRFLDGFD